MNGGSKCKHCGVFTKKMNEHLFRCEATRPYVCNAMNDGVKCGRRFPSDRALGVHKGTFHTAEEKGSTYRCMYCSHGTESAASHAKHQSRCGRGEISRRTRSRSRGPSVTRSQSRDPSMVRSVPTTPMHAADDDNTGVFSASAIVRRSRVGDIAASSPFTREHSSEFVADGGDSRRRRRRTVSHGGGAGREDTTIGTSALARAVPVTTPPRSAAVHVARRQSTADDTNQDDGNTEEVSMDDGGNGAFEHAPPVDEQGVYNLRLLNPSVARRIMYEQHKHYDDIMLRMAKRLNDLKELVAKYPNNQNLSKLDLSCLDDQLEDYFENHTAEVLEARGKVNLGIAERAASQQSAYIDSSGCSTSNTTNN